MKKKIILGIAVALFLVTSANAAGYVPNTIAGIRDVVGMLWNRLDELIVWDYNKGVNHRHHDHSGTYDSGAQISTAGLADNAVTSAKIAAGAVGTADIAADAIDTTHVAAGALQGVDIATGSISSLQLASGSVLSEEILDGAVATIDIADDAVTSAKIAADTVAAADIATGAVTTDEILDATIATGDIADGAVTTAKILDGTIANADISATAAIDTSKLSGAVTSIASNGLGSLATASAVSGGTGGTITDDTITNADINSLAAIADTKLATIATAGKVSDTALSANVSLLGSSIDTAEIADGAVQATKLSTAARTNVVAVQIGDIALAISGTTERPIFVSPGNGTVTAISFTNASGITGAANLGTLSVERKTATAITVDSFALTASMTAYTAVRDTTPTGGTALAAGNVYSFKYVQGSVGQALDEMLVTLEYTVSE